MNALTLADLERLAEGLEPDKAQEQSIPSALPASSHSSLGQQVRDARSGDLETAKDALSQISSDVLRGIGNIIGPDGQAVSDYWFGVILALRREFGDAGREVARDWSKKSSRYADDGFANAWNAYDPDHPKPVTIGSVFKLAKAKGWQRAVAPSPPTSSPVVSRFCLLDRSAIMAAQPISWRVKGLLPEKGLAAIYGPSGSGKSFLTIDLAVSIALGRKWFDCRTTPCPVTYVMLEGEAGLRNRAEAWEKHNRMTIPDGFNAITQPFNIANDQDVSDLAAVLPREGITIIDTLNRAAPGMDENSSQDMGRMLAGMKRIQQVTEGLVLVVHHTGKDSSRGLRGHSSLHAALDGAIEVERTAKTRSWSAAKVKDGADGESKLFKLNVVDLGQDLDGDPVTSCAVGPDLSALFAPKVPTGTRQGPAYKAIQQALRASSDRGKGGAGGQVTCLRVDDAITATEKTLVTEVARKRHGRAKNIVQSLIDGDYLRSGLDGNEDAWLWL